jgi:hypothetical protein
MISLPRTPLKEKLPLFGALSAFFSKGSGACRRKHVDSVDNFRKSLMLEQNLPTGYYRFSTCRAPSSMDCSVSSTNAFLRFRRPISLYLSLLKEKKKRKRVAFKQTLIHGIKHLLKKASTGYNPITRLTRGYPWMRFLITSKAYVLKITHPRIHGLFCPWVLFESEKWMI